MNNVKIIFLDCRNIVTNRDLFHLLGIKCNEAKGNCVERKWGCWHEGACRHLAKFDTFPGCIRLPHPFPRIIEFRLPLSGDKPVSQSLHVTFINYSFVFPFPARVSVLAIPMPGGNSCFDNAMNQLTNIRFSIGQQWQTAVSVWSCRVHSF